MNSIVLFASLYFWLKGKIRIIMTWDSYLLLFDVTLCMPKPVRPDPTILYSLCSSSTNQFSSRQPPFLLVPLQVLLRPAFLFLPPILISVVLPLFRAIRVFVRFDPAVPNRYLVAGASCLVPFLVDRGSGFGWFLVRFILLIMMPSIFVCSLASVVGLWTEAPIDLSRGMRGDDTCSGSVLCC